MSLREYTAMIVAMMLLVLIGIWLTVLFLPKPAGQHHWRNLGTLAALIFTMVVALFVYAIVSLWTSPFASQLASHGTVWLNLGYLFPAFGVYILLFFISNLRRARRDATRNSAD